MLHAEQRVYSGKLIKPRLTCSLIPAREARAKNDVLLFSLELHKLVKAPQGERVRKIYADIRAELRSNSDKKFDRLRINRVFGIPSRSFNVDAQLCGHQRATSFSSRIITIIITARENSPRATFR